MTATRSLGSVSEPTLFMALELGAQQWKLGLASGLGDRVWVKTIGAGDWAKLRGAVEQAKRRFRLPASAPVVSCYEAGRDGFWVHRALVAEGYANRVVDSASIEVSRRARRAKTDRLDARQLVQLLIRAWLGDDAWREVRVPSEAEEAERETSRDRTALTQEQTRLRNQLHSLLALHGAKVPKQRGPGWWAAVRNWRGEPLPTSMQARLARVNARLVLLGEQLAAVTAEERATAQAAAADSALGRLVRLRGVAAPSASVLLGEGLVWRQFRNRREVGGFVGFAPVPYQSGEQARDQGISRAGNMRLRSVSIQLAWGWLRWQRSSALSQWYERRFGGRGARARRIGIVALARKLLILLWRYATTGVRPDDVLLKAA